MDFELDDLQQELQRVARDLVDRECPPSLVRAVAEGRPEGQSGSEELWKTLVGLEWPGLTVPAAHGGTEASVAELMLVLEELGRGADPTPMLATTSQYVPVVQECLGEAAGELLAAVCGGGTGAVAFAAGDVTAEPDGDRWRLQGQAHPVLDGDRADEIAVAATAGDHPGVFVVPAGSVTATRTPSFDATLHVAEVSLDGTLVPPGRAATGPSIASGLARAREVAVTALAATMVGASQRLLELALGHVRDRKQFGVPIGSFQAVKHLTVDVFVAIQRAQALCHFAAVAIAEDDQRRARAASMAKAAAGDAQRIAIRHGIQLFGGLGFTWENDLQLFVRRAKAGELLLGSSAAHRAIVARAALAPHRELEGKAT